MLNNLLIEALKNKWSVWPSWCWKLWK